ncbi:Crp/Fnr family transcriptional regulator [Hymenobacter sp. HD11105]
MTDPLVAHIQRFIPVSPALAERLTAIATVQSMEKGSYLHQPGRVCRHTYFVTSGLLRVFYRKEDKEVTDHFAAEGEWITSLYSFLTSVPDACYIQTLERCDLLAISLTALEQCFTDFPPMERFGRMLLARLLKEQSERIVSLQFHTAKERYEFFQKTAQNILPRVPLGMLASHLGITQETLSRVRAGKRGI